VKSFRYKAQIYATLPSVSQSYLTESDRSATDKQRWV